MERQSGEGTPFYTHRLQMLVPSLTAPLLLCTGSVLAQRQPQPLAPCRGSRAVHGGSDGCWCKGWMATVTLGHCTVLQTHSKGSGGKGGKQSHPQRVKMKALRQGAEPDWTERLQEPWE